MVMKSIDIKSLLIGILGTALVMVLMGQTSLQNRYDVECVKALGDTNPYIVCRKFDLSSGAWDSMPNRTATFQWLDLKDVKSF